MEQRDTGMYDVMGTMSLKNGMENLSEDAVNRQVAGKRFERAMRLGWRKRLQAVMVGHSRRLLDLSSETLHASDQAYMGVQEVPLELIRGSENRTHDFDVEFFPLREHNEQRWISVMIARMDGKTLPPVQLIEVGGVYYVRDGHHRISVARLLNQKSIDAEVISYRD
jgi:hypothetical protein